MSYEAPVTRFTQVLNSKGENVTLYPLKAYSEPVVYGEGLDIKALAVPSKAEEVLIEPGYYASDYLTLHLFAPVRRHDKICRNGVDYEVLGVQEYTFKGETAYRKVECRRLLGQ
ncbi:MAG: hypothetical protein NWF04_06230 [Candidatus Bathyarchaeota archaeon]|nr:hypothetical protein [Candidatus Bathyarchaeota archaeon]